VPAQLTTTVRSSFKVLGEGGANTARATVTMATLLPQFGFALPVIWNMSEMISFVNSIIGHNSTSPGETGEQSWIG
jgi:hypothetical protein